MGKHSLMFGYQYHRNSDTFLDLQAPQGYMQFTGIYSNKSGFGFADFLLGDVASTIYNTPLDVHQFLPGHSFFGQDTWRIARNLTVNYGLRYELYAPMLNRTNSVSNFTTANGGGLIAAAANARGWSDRALIDADKNNFAPRFGFSYQPSEKVVFRGGYGVFYQFINRIGSESQLALNQPFLKAVQTTQSVGSVTPVFEMKNGFPGAQYSGSVVPLTLQKNNWQDPNQRTSYIEQASFGPQVQLSSNTVMELIWVGNWGRKLNRLRNANQGVVTGFTTHAAAVDGHFFKPFAHLHPRQKFPSTSLLVMGGLSALACLFSLSDLISVLIVIQTLTQSGLLCIAVMLLRRKAITSSGSFRMPLYPLPAIVALAGWS